MKTLKFLANVFIICFALLKAVSSTTQIHTASDGREYFIEPQLKHNWYEAWHECARRNSQLVIIDSAAKNKAIIDLLQSVIGKSHNLWLGGNDEYSSSTDYNRPFFWSATGDSFNFTFWSDNNPDNYLKQEHCVHIWSAKPLYQWNDIACTNKMGFICEANHHIENCNKKVNNKCDAVKKSSSSLSVEVNKAQKQQLSEINLKIQKSYSLEKEWQTELQQWQETAQAAIQKIATEQQNTIKQLIEQKLKQVSELNAELKESTAVISTQIEAKLIANQNEITEVC